MQSQPPRLAELQPIDLLNRIAVATALGRHPGRQPRKPWDSTIDWPPRHCIPQHACGPCNKNPHKGRSQEGCCQFRGFNWCHCKVKHPDSTYPGLHCQNAIQPSVHNTGFATCPTRISCASHQYVVCRSEWAGSHASQQNIATPHQPHCQDAQQGTQNKKEGIGQSCPPHIRDCRSRNIAVKLCRLLPFTFFAH